MAEGKYTGFYLPERFIGNPRSEQMASHLIEIYSFKDLFWHQRTAQYLVPGGMLQKIISLDFGTLLPEIAETANVEERQKPHRKQHNLENLKGSKSFRLPESLRSLERYIVSKFEIKEDDVSYSFDLRKESITLERPLEFHITEYLRENKKVIVSSRQKALVWARKRRNSKIPAGDFDLRYFPDETDVDQN